MMEFLSLTAIGAGISVSANTGSINISNTGVTSLTAGAGISLDASTGAVEISATGGGGAMTSWNLTADSGGTESITDAEYVSIEGGTNISTNLSGTGTLGDPYVIEIDSTSVVSGTQNYIAKFTNATTVGDSRVFDAGVAGFPIGIDSTDVTSPAYGVAFGDTLLGVALQTNSSLASFAVVNEFDVNSNLPANKFGENNVLIVPTGLDAADPTTPSTNFRRNVVIGSKASTTMTTETDCVLIGYNVHNGSGGPIDGDVVIGSGAAESANFTGGAGVNASILIGRNAANTGAIKRGTIAIGDNVAFNGIGEGSTLLGVEVCYNTDS